MKKESKENKPNIAQALSDKKNILYENNLLGISNACRGSFKYSSLHGCSPHCDSGDEVYNEHPKMC